MHDEARLLPNRFLTHSIHQNGVTELFVRQRLNRGEQTPCDGQGHNMKVRRR